MLWVKQLILCSCALENSLGTVLFQKLCHRLASQPRLWECRFWITNCLLNAAGVLWAGRCHSMASYTACGFVVVCHLHCAVPGQEQEFYLMRNPRKGLEPVSLLGSSIYLTLAAAEGAAWHNFSCFTIISLIILGIEMYQGEYSGLNILWSQDQRICRTRVRVVRMFLQSLFIT